MARSVRRIVGTRRTRSAVAKGEIKELPSVSVKCAFCAGTGKDPFGCMSYLSNCQVCKGRGVVWLTPPIKECAFCGGTGILPHSPHRLPCAACGGKGWVTAIQPGMEMECPSCGGTGFTMAPLPVYCLTCRGQGVVLRRE